MSDAPRDLPALQRLIAARRDALPRRLTQIADLALDRPQALAFGRVADVAASAGVPPSALVRFAQALGYAGFSQMQAVFLSRARERWPDYRERLAALDPQAGPAALLGGFLRASAASVEAATASIDPAALERAVMLLAGAGTVYLLGARRSFPATSYLSYALRRLAVRCELIDQMAGMETEHAALIRPADALLAVSFLPYATRTLDVAAVVHARGVPVVAITDSAASPLARLATVWLEVAEADHAGFRSLAATFALAATLAVAVAARRGQAGASDDAPPSHIASACA